MGDITENIANNSEEQQVVGVPFTKEDKRINKNGRPKESKEKKMIRKATKEFIAEYKDKLAEALPKLSPVLIKKAMSGDISAIKEINDRVMGKPPMDLNLGNAEGLPFNINIVKDAGTDNKTIQSTV